MPDEQPLRPVIWVGTSRKDLREFPEPVQDHMGYALYVAQRGGKHRDAKALSGFDGAGVVESGQGLPRRHVPLRLHPAICRDGLCASRLPEEIEDRMGNAAPGHGVD